MPKGKAHNHATIDNVVHSYLCFLIAMDIFVCYQHKDCALPLFVVNKLPSFCSNTNAQHGVPDKKETSNTLAVNKVITIL